MITYGLGTITNNSGDKQNSLNTPKATINIPIGLSEEDYNKLLAATSSVGNIYSYAGMFNTTMWNYADLVSIVNSYLQAFVQKDKKFLTKRDITLNINKDVLNVFSSFRFYLDYIDKNLQNNFGKESELVTNFRKYCSNEYDKNFSYRLIYHLRNYAQHKGLVVSSIQFSEHLDTANPNLINRQLKIYVDQKDLIEDKTFKREVKTELKDLPENIDLMEHLSKWMDCLPRIHNQLMHNIIPTSLVDAKLIINQASRLSYNRNDDRIVPIISAINHADENIQEIKTPSFVPFPIEDAQRIIEYCQKNNMDVI